MPIDEHTPVPQEARGIYGFVLFLLMKICVFFYFIWMFLPLEVIQSLPYGPPQQYWGIAVPVFFCTGLFMFAFYIYPALHGLYDCKFDDPSSITDQHSHSENYFEECRAKAKMALPLSRPKRRNKPGPLKAVKVSAEIQAKSMTLSANEKKFREKILPIRRFPDCDTKPIPPVCDLELDFVCKKILYDTP